MFYFTPANDLRGVQSYNHRHFHFHISLSWHLLWCLSIRSKSVSPTEAVNRPTALAFTTLFQLAVRLGRFPAPRAWEPADLLMTLPGENESWLGFTRWRPGALAGSRGSRGSGDSCRRGEVAPGTPGWPRRPPCRSRWGPLAMCVNTDDFSVCPHELTLLGDVGFGRRQCQGRRLCHTCTGGGAGGGGGFHLLMCVVTHWCLQVISFTWVDEPGSDHWRLNKPLNRSWRALPVSSRMGPSGFRAGHYGKSLGSSFCIWA